MYMLCRYIIIHFLELNLLCYFSKLTNKLERFSYKNIFFVVFCTLTYTVFKVSLLYTGCLMKNASTHNFFIYYPISMNKKIKDMVFQALQNSHKIFFFLALSSIVNDSQLFFFLMDTCSFLGLVW
jgi:hypothetical protein